MVFNLIPCQNPSGPDAAGMAKVTISEQKTGQVAMSSTVGGDIPNAGSQVELYDYTHGGDLGNPNGTAWFTLNAQGNGQVSWAGSWPGGSASMPASSDDVALLVRGSGWSIMQTWSGSCFGPLT